MEWPAVLYSVGVGIGLFLVGVALIALTVSAIPLIREARRLAGDARRLAALTEDELRPTLRDVRETAANLNELSVDVAPKLERLGDLMENADRTLDSVREASETVNRYAGVPAMGIASLAAGLRRAGGVFGRGRGGESPVESDEQAEGTRG